MKTMLSWFLALSLVFHFHSSVLAQDNTNKICSSAPCQNSGTCSEYGPNDFACLCAYGFAGKMCQFIEAPKDCDVKLGCNVLPAGCTDNCHTITSYLYNVESNLMEMTIQTIKKWAAVGFNDKSVMPGVRGVLCKREPTDIVTLTSFKASGQRRPTIQNLAKGNNIIFSAKDGSMTFCVYQRTITVPEESQEVMFDLSVPRHLLMAAGDTNEDGQIRYHAGERSSTPTPIDAMRFRTIPLTTSTSTTTTSTPTTTTTPITTTTATTTPTTTTTTPTTTTTTTTTSTTTTATTTPTTTTTTTTPPTTTTTTTTPTTTTTTTTTTPTTTTKTTTTPTTTATTPTTTTTTPTTTTTTTTTPTTTTTTTTPTTTTTATTPTTTTTTITTPTTKTTTPTTTTTTPTTTTTTPTTTTTIPTTSTSTATSKTTTPTTIKTTPTTTTTTPTVSSKTSSTATTPLKMTSSSLPQPTKFLKEFCTDRHLEHAGYYAHPINKQRYVVCWQGRGWLFQCRDNLQWRVTGKGLGACDYP